MKYIRNAVLLSFLALLIPGHTCFSASIVELWSVDLGKHVYAFDYGDVTGDTVSDVVLAVGATGLQGAEFVVLKNSGSELWRKTYSADGPRSVVIANLNGDVRQDVVLSTSAGHAIRAFDADGVSLWDGNLTTYVDALVAGDFNGDGLDDIAAATWGQSAAWKHDGTPLWNYSGPNHSVPSLSVGNLDGDTNDDVLLGSWSLDGRLYALSGAGSLLWTYGSTEHTRSGWLLNLDSDLMDEVIGTRYAHGTYDVCEVFALDHDANPLWSRSVGAAKAVVVDDLSPTPRVIAFTATSLLILDAETGVTLDTVPISSGPVHRHAVCVGHPDTGDGLALCSLDQDKFLRVRDGSGKLVAQIAITDTLEHKPGKPLVILEAADVTGDGFDEILVSSSVFRVFELSLPTANASENLNISSETQVLTVIHGLASDPDNDPLTYRWLEGTSEVSASQPVGEFGEAYLDLSTVPHFSIGQHTLTLEVSDGQATATDDMILTIDNSAPHVAPTGYGTYEIFSSVDLGGQASDFDGDSLDYVWSEDLIPLFTGQIYTVFGGEPAILPVHTISDLSLGNHTLTLSVYDGINAQVASDIVVKITDTTDPTIVPTPNVTILWPPNHKMVDIIIEVAASDNSGGPVILSASITSDEPIEGLGDGDMTPDWTEPFIDSGNGLITFQLRAERSGTEDGRVYTVTVTATDGSGNSSDAQVEIIVPHDKQEK
ncbi:hypothetical protein ACFL0Q_03045 [Thermodesulfobacteriota bacterium]